MEEAAQTGSRRRNLVGEKKEKMSLEYYVDFFTSRKSLGFTINFLNQIIHMHGFLKIHKSRKNVIADAINTMDLIDPWRSTLKQNLTSPAATAAPTLEEVTADLECLKWQECCVTSLQILNAEKEAAQSAPPVSELKHKSRKRKKGSMKRIMKWSNGDESKAGKATRNPDVLKKEVNKKKKKKKKKKKIRAAVKPTGGCGEGEFGYVEATPLPSLEVSRTQILK